MSLGRPPSIGRRQLAAVVAVALLASLPASGRAGAWTQPVGHVYARASYAYLNSRVRFDEHGERVGLEATGQPVRGTEYSLRELRLYGEYGAAGRLTLYGSTAYKRARLLVPQSIVFGRVLAPESHRTSGFGDLNTGVRLRLLDGRVPISVAGEAKIPTGYSTTANPALGNGERDVTARALAGSSVGPLYGTADAAWTHRGGAFVDELGGSFEAGGRLLDYYTIRGVIRGLRPVGTPRSASEGALFDPATSSPRSLTFDLAVGAEVLAGMTLEAAFSKIISGENTLAGTSFEAGLVWSIRAR